MSGSAGAEETVVLGLRVAVGARDKLAKLSELMWIESGTWLTMIQALEIAITEALARRQRQDGD